MLISVFLVGLTRFLCLGFGDIYVETNEDNPSDKNVRQGLWFFGDIRFMRIFARALVRRGVS